MHRRMLWTPLLWALATLILASPVSFGADDGSTQSPYLSLVDNLIDTGIQRDQISPLHQPSFISTTDASLALSDEELVFVAEYPSGPRVYPRQILVWHEVVNDLVDNQRVSVTYCPITGSLIGYKGHVGRFDTPFGHTGKLLNSNSVLYDYSTNSKWPQILGEAIEGPLEGKQIEMFPVVWTTWGKAKVRYPNAQVLDRPSASRRPYGKDPYGSYQRPPTYYQNDQVLYPVMHVDRSLHPKEPVLGIKMETLRLAIVKRSVAAMGVANIDIGMVPLVALYDPGLDAIRIFQRQAGNKTLNFLMQDNKIYDRESMTEWTPDGKGAYGRYRDQQLTQVPAMEVMWFAWTAFYPDTAIFR